MNVATDADGQERRKLTSVTTIVVRALCFSQGGRMWYSAVIPSQTLAQCQVARFDEKLEEDDEKQGYQRSLLERRKKKVEAYYAKVEGTVCPPVILNDHSGTARFNPDEVQLGTTECISGILEFDPSSVFVLDGSHRQAGVSPLTDYLIPIMLGTEPNVMTEKKLFNVINSEAKSVTTECCAQNDWTEAVVDGWDNWDDTRKDQALGTGIVRNLNSDKNSILHNAFILGKQTKIKIGEIKDGLKERYAKPTSFSQSLKNRQIFSLCKESCVLQDGTPLLDTDGNPADALANISKVIDAFWKGVVKCLPDCFETPWEYCCHNSLGMLVLHASLARCLQLLNNSDKDYFTPNAYRDILTQAPCFSNPDMWLSDGGQIGGAGTSNKAAKNVFEKYIAKYLKSRKSKSSEDGPVV